MMMMMMMMMMMTCVCDGCHGNISAGQGAMFAAADEFSHLLDDDIASSSTLADVIGSGAVYRHDNAGNIVVFHIKPSILSE